MEKIIGKRAIIVTIFLGFIIILLIFVLTIVKSNQNNIETKGENEEIYTASYYKVLDSYGLPGHETFGNTIKKENILASFNELYLELSEAKNFRYMEIYECLIQFKGKYDNGDKFVYEYNPQSDNEDINEFVNQEVKIENEETLITNLKGLFVGKRGFKEDFTFQHKVVEGNEFSDEDFLYKNGNINAILGNDYSEIYEIGDELEILYLGYPLTLKIIGFLEDNTYFTIGNDSISLDVYIVLPSFEVDEKSIIDSEFGKMHSSNRTRGYFNINDNVAIEEALTEFESIVDKVKLDYVYIPVED